MGASNKTAGLLKYNIKKCFKRNGFNILRYIFNATERISGQESTFFIELATVNPYINPHEVVLGFKPRVNISPEDLHNMLAGSVAAKNLQSEELVLPSYMAVRVGVLGGVVPKSLCDYESVKNVSMSQRSFDVRTECCHFTDDTLEGQIVCSKNSINEHPEFLCDSGTMQWNLRYKKDLAFSHGFKDKMNVWSCPGARTTFAGTVVFDGKEYVVSAKKSFGYIEHIWQKTGLADWFHISSSNLTSIFTGKLMQNSVFAVHGEYNKRLSVLTFFEGRYNEFAADSSKRSYKTIYECTQTPNGEDEKEQLHWSVSVNSKTYVLDIDVFCLSNQMYVRSLELPEGKRQLIKLLCGIAGSGEIRLYKKIHKSLELIEQAHIATALCEFGKIESDQSTC